MGCNAEQELPIPNTPVYRLEELLARVTNENIHEEYLTGSAVGEEFP